MLTLAPVFLGALAQRRLASLFSLIAIMLGVALGMAVQAIHEAALSEFGRGVRSMAGEADLQIVGPASGFDEGIYAKIAAQPGVAEASPIIDLEVRLAGSEDSLRLLGVDVFTLARVAPYLLPRSADSSDRLATLAEDRIFLSASALDAQKLKIGDTLTLQAGTQAIPLRIAGDLPGVPDGRNLAVMDVAAAQSQFGQIGRISRIDLRLQPDARPATLQEQLQALLPAGVQAQAPEVVAEQAGQLSRAYRVNLGMLAAIALLTGGFLVFSAQALSVVRRRTEFAFLRALGLDRQTLLRWLLAEGAVVGLVGGVLGVGLGYALAWGALQLLGGDLGAGYFAGLQPTLQFQPGLTGLFILFGVGTGLAGAWLPARQSAGIAPAQALKAADDGGLPSGRGAPWFGVALLGFSPAACTLPPIAGLPLGGYAAIAALLAGTILLLPLAAHWLSAVLSNRGSVPWRLATARIVSTPGHAVVAAAGVLTSVALAAAMAIMVASFRDSVDQWLSQVLPADLYVRAGRAHSAAHLDPDLQARIADVAGIEQVRFTRHDQLRLNPESAPVALIARPIAGDGSDLPLVGASLTVDRPALWISEAMADQHGWQRGQLVRLPLGGEAREFLVAGVWRDYSRQTGALMIDLALYQQLTGDRRINDAAITLASGALADEVAEAVRALAPASALEIAHPGEIRRISLDIFDRTFAVTYLLEVVAIVIGLSGVAASFAGLAAARRREFGMLRHLGISRRQIAGMLAIEGGCVAAVGVLTGLLAGGGIGLILIDVVNRQSFHWSMDLHVPWLGLSLFAVALIALAALAAVLAGRQAMRQSAILAVREDW
jgi:putative ABC transport system permease protein